MNILALDLATATGWALAENGRIESGVQDFSKKRGETNGILFLRFNRWLDEIATKDGKARVRVIAYEQAHHRGGAATQIGVGLGTRVDELCAKHGIECLPVHSATLKKHATGSGRADKAAMCAAASRFAGHAIRDDNEADALLLLKYAQDTLSG